jgi:hypothetical protein
MISELEKYEEFNLHCYTDNDPNKYLFRNDIFKDSKALMLDNMKNPMEEMYHWVKGEIYDLQALL